MIKGNSELTLSFLFAFLTSRFPGVILNIYYNYKRGMGMIKILSAIIAFVMMLPSYCFSFLPKNFDENFEVIGSGYADGAISLGGETVSAEKSIDGKKTAFDFGKIKTGWFNYYGVKYKSDAYMRGEVTYLVRNKEYTEEFFLEPCGEANEFHSFIDGCLDNRKANGFCEITFEPLDKEMADFTLYGIGLFNREVPKDDVFIESNGYKLGVNLVWGGALSYLEDTDSNVQAVKKDGKIFVDSKASERYGVRSVNNNVNLINRYDPGRLVQQSYYGTSNYDCGEFMGNRWNYNPVQGGNQFGESSKIVDLICDENSIYIKCRPLDWAKSAEDITPSYMEAIYMISKGLINISCRFVDFSGYDEAYTTQEMPAFYCIEPFNRFVYYSGDKPWIGDTKLSYENKLIFWPDAGYPNFNSTENWSAFIGEFDDSFGIGLYVPNEASFLAGVFDRENTTEKDPSVDDSTSYIAAVEWHTFKSFNPMEYSYYISTGTAGEIRSNFETIRR